MSMGFSRQEKTLSPRDLPNPGIWLASPMSPALAGVFFITGTTWELFKVDSLTKFWHMYQVQVGHKHRNTHNSTQHIQRCRGFLVSSCELPSGSPFLFSPIPVPVKPLTVFCPSRSAFLFHFSSVQCSCSVVSNPLRPHESQHARPPCPSPTPGVHSDSHPSSQWCHPAISSPVVPFSSCPQSLPALGSFPMSQLFAWGGQSIGVSASASVLPMNTQDWFPLGWTGWISLQSKGLSRVFSNNTVKKHQFFSTQLSYL